MCTLVPKKEGENKETNYHVHGSDVAMDNRLRIIDSRIAVVNITLLQNGQA